MKKNIKNFLHPLNSLIQRFKSSAGKLIIKIKSNFTLLYNYPKKLIENTRKTWLFNQKLNVYDKLNELQRGAILSLYDQVKQEITRYRDLEWKIVLFVSAFLYGAALIAKNFNYCFYSNHEETIKILFTIVGAVALLVSFWFIYHAHKNLNWNRNMRIKLEKLFGFFNEKVYFDGKLIIHREEPIYYWYTKVWHIIFFYLTIIMLFIYDLYEIWNKEFIDFLFG